MIHLTKKIVFMIILLTIFFNIERLDAGQENLINMNSSVYVFGFIGALVPFFVQINGRFGSELLILAIAILYFSCEAVLNGVHPLWGGVNTFLTICELAFLSAIISLADILAKETRILLRQTEVFSTSPQSLACPTLEQERDKLEIEMARCRRYERNLGVIIVEPQHGFHPIADSLKDLHPVISNSLVMRAVGHFLQRLIRRPDWLLDDVEKNRFIIVCPESSGSDLTNTITRLQPPLDGHLDVFAKLGYAAFPDDAVTLDGLFQIAQSRLHLSTGAKELETIVAEGERIERPTILVSDTLN